MEDGRKTRDRQEMEVNVPAKSADEEERQRGEEVGESKRTGRSADE